MVLGKDGPAAHLRACSFWLLNQECFNLRTPFGGDDLCDLSSQEKVDFFFGVSERFVLNIKCVMVLNICIFFSLSPLCCMSDASLLLFYVIMLHFIQKYSLQRRCKEFLCNLCWVTFYLRATVLGYYNILFHAGWCLLLFFLVLLR